MTDLLVRIINAVKLCNLKAEILSFQSQLLKPNPYSNSVKENWQRFISAIHKAIVTHIPQRLSKLTTCLPWLSPSMEKLMNQRTHLHKRAKCLQTVDAWSKYRTMRNEITESIHDSHARYQNRLLTCDGELN